MQVRENKIVAFGAMCLCVFITSVSWMYMRMPQYAEKLLNGESNAGWLLSGYIIAEVSMIIIAGTILDRIGVKNTILIGTSLFSGSAVALCMTDSMDLMIFFRVIQGCGAGFLFTVAIGCIPKLFPRSKRDLPHELITTMFALGSLFGTAIGLWFIEEIGDWRPFIQITAVAVLILGAVAYVTMPVVKRLFIRDIPGMVLCIALVGAVMTYSQMLGNDFEFYSIENLAFIEFCLILAVLLYFVERRAEDPIIPRGITRTQIGLMAGMFLIGFCGLGILQYLILFFVVVYKFTLYEASAMLIFLLMGGGLTSMLGTKVLAKIGIRKMALMGPLFVLFGYMVGAILLPIGPIGGAVTLFIIGLGFGSMITEMVIAIQAITPVKDSGTATSMLMSIRFMGIILGIAAYGTIIKGPLESYIENIQGPTSVDIVEWVITNLANFYDDLLRIFQDTIVQACTIAGIAVISVFIIIYFLVGKEDLDAPEMKDE